MAPTSGDAPLSTWSGDLSLVGCPTLRHRVPPRCAPVNSTTVLNGFGLPLPSSVTQFQGETAHNFPSRGGPNSRLRRLKSGTPLDLLPLPVVTEGPHLSTELRPCPPRRCLDSRGRETSRADEPSPGRNRKGHVTQGATIPKNEEQGSAYSDMLHVGALPSARRRRILGVGTAMTAKMLHC